MITQITFLFESLVKEIFLIMNFYLLFKSLHLIAVYLGWQDFYIYHAFLFIILKLSHESQKNIFKIMEKKLYNYIMMPAMLLSWLFGIGLIHSLGFSVFSELWMQIKIISVLILTHYHFTLGKYLKRFCSR